MELTPEERRKIYEEEKAKAERPVSAQDHSAMQIVQSTYEWHAKLDKPLRWAVNVALFIAVAALLRALFGESASGIGMTLFFGGIFFALVSGATDVKSRFPNAKKQGGMICLTGFLLMMFAAKAPVSSQAPPAQQAETALSNVQPAAVEPPPAEPTPVPPMKPIALKGRGQAATKKFHLAGGLYKFDMHHVGDSNFAVVLLDSHGGRHGLLANDIGNFNGSKAESVQDGDYLLDVTASGPWTITIGEP